MPNPNERRPARKPDPKAANARRGEKSRSAKGPAPARVAALEALMDVQISDAYAGLALTRRIASARLSALDRRLMTELFYGVLENRICLDYILSKYMERPCGDDVTLDILRMGVYQLVFMDRIPENAACSGADAPLPQREDERAGQRRAARSGARSFPNRLSGRSCRVPLGALFLPALAGGSAHRRIRHGFR